MDLTAKIQDNVVANYYDTKLITIVIVYLSQNTLTVAL